MITPKEAFQKHEPTGFVSLFGWCGLERAACRIVIVMGNRSNTWDQNTTIEDMYDDRTEQLGFCGLIACGYLRACDESEAIDGDWPWAFRVTPSFIKILEA